MALKSLLTLAALLAAANSQTVTEIPAGVTVSGSVNASQPVYYMTSIAYPFTAVRISLMAAYGNPDIFASVGLSSPLPSPPLPSSPLSGKQQIGVDVIDIRATDAIVTQNCPRSGQPGDKCVIKMAISSETAASGFTLMVHDGRTPLLLSGSTITGLATANSITYYRYIPLNGSDGKPAPVSFTVTSTTGATTLLLSSTRVGGNQPTAANPTSYCAAYFPLDNNKLETNNKGDANAGPSSTGTSNGGTSTVARIAFGPNDACFCADGSCAYTIGITADDFAAYSLSITDNAVQGGATKLFDGIILDNAVVDGASDQYEFTFVPAVVTNPARIVSFALSAYYGDVTIAARIITPNTVATDTITLANADYVAAVVGGNAVVRIGRSDPLFAAACGGPDSTAQCTIRVAVIANQQQQQQQQRVGYSAYSIVAHTETGGVINDGNPTLSAVVAGAYSYHRFTQVVPATATIITITPLSGDVDMYVNLVSGDATSLPTAQQATFSVRASIGGTVLVVQPTDPALSACSYPCTFVVGTTPSANMEGTVAFSLLVRQRGPWATWLLSGQPSVDYAYPGDRTYYTVGLPLNGNALRVRAKPLTLPDATPLPAVRVYARVGDGPIDPNDASTFQYVSPEASAAELLISAQDAAFSTPCSQVQNDPSVCSITLLVSVTAPTAFSIMATTGIEIVQDASSIAGYLAPGETKYLAYFPPNGASVSRLALTPLAGVPTLYASRTVARPTAATALYSVTPYDSAVVSLQLGRDNCAATSSVLCVYYIAVTNPSAAAAAVYNLEASSNRIVPVALGIATPWKSGAGVSYFSAYVPDLPSSNSDLYITVASRNGSLAPAVLATTSPIGVTPQLPTGSCTTQACDGSTYSGAMWASAPVRSTNSLVISRTETAFCVRCNIIIAVLDASAVGAEFSLTVSAAAIPPVLIPAWPLEFYLSNEASLATFRTLVPVDNSSAVTLQVSPLISEVVLYGSAGAGNQVYSAGVGEGYKLTFSQQDLTACVAEPSLKACFVTGSVVPAVFPSSALVHASSSSLGYDTMRLVEGRPARGTVEKDARVVYTASFVGSALPVILTVQELVGDVALFVTLDGSVPSEANNAAAAVNVFGSHALQVTIPSSAQGQTVKVSVTVVGLTFARFQLTYVLDSVPLLIPGVIRQAGTAVGAYSYWTLPIGPDAGNLVITATDFVGETKIFVTRISATDFSTRPAAGASTFTSHNDRTLTITNACEAGTVCYYAIGVACLDTFSSAPTCEYLLSTTVQRTTLLTRLVNGLPVRSVVGANQYQYLLYERPVSTATFALDFNIESGSINMIATDRFLPGVSATAQLPNANDASTFQYVMPLDESILKVTPTGQAPSTPRKPLGGASSILYTVGITSTEPATYYLSAILAGTPSLLLPGQASTDHKMAPGGSELFAIDVRDPTTDIEVVVSVAYGKIALAIGARGAEPVCTVDANGVATCANALWQASTGPDGIASIRLSPRKLCNSTARVPTTPCDDSLDLVRGIYLVSVVGIRNSLASITARYAMSTVRVYDGRPISISQDADYAPQVFLYQTLPESGLSDLRITFSTNVASADATYFLSSCVDDACTPANERPGPSQHLMMGTIAKGARADLVITKNDPLYCLGNANVGDVCNYYLTVYPQPASCVANAPCITTVSVTITLMDSSANVEVNYNLLGDKLTVFSAEAAPGKYSTYALYTHSETQLTSNMFVRLESCDTLAGYVAAFFCENPSSYSSAGDPSTGIGSNGQPFCRVVRRPAVDDFQFSMSTAPDSEGGDGRSRLAILGSPAGLFHGAVTVPQPNPNYDAARKKFGASLYELQVAVGAGVYIKQPTRDGVGALTARIVPAEIDRAYLSWTAPLILNDPAAAGWDYTTYAQGVTYKIYVAHRGFARAAAWVTNTTLGAAGVIPTTACGLDRWERLVRPNITSVFTTAETSFVLTGLAVAEPYEVNIVALCDGNCLRDNAARFGYAQSATGLSLQRLPYAPIMVQTIAPTEVVDAHDSGHNKLTSALAPIGIVATIILIAAVAFLVYKQNKAAEAKLAAAKIAGTAGATAASFTGSTGAAGGSRVANRDTADELFKPRSPTMRKGLIASSPAATIEMGTLTAQAVAPTHPDGAGTGHNW